MRKLNKLHLSTTDKWDNQFEIDQCENDQKHDSTNNKRFKGGNPEKWDWISSIKEK